MSNTSPTCKYCGNNTSSSLHLGLEGLKRTLRTEKGRIAYQILQAREDEEFAKILHKKYCCASARYDAEDEYEKYFPYHGMLKQQRCIDIMYCDARELAELISDLTPEEYAGIQAKARSEANPERIWELIEDIKESYDALKELSMNTKLAYKREKDPKRRELLDGRKEE